METKNVTATTDENGAFEITVELEGGPGIKVVSAVASSGGAAAGADLKIADPNNGGSNPNPVTATYYSNAGWGGAGDHLALTVFSDGSAIFVRVTSRRTRRWEASFSSIPSSGTLAETDRSSGIGCDSISSAPGPAGGPSPSISLISADATQAELYVGGGGGAEFPLILPAASIPAEPALTGDCIR